MPLEVPALMQGARLMHQLLAEPSVQGLAGHVHKAIHTGGVVWLLALS